MSLTGRTKDFTSEVSGSGDINCGGLESENATVKLPEVGMPMYLPVFICLLQYSGSGDVYYRGNPSSPEIHTSGSGTVEPDK